MEPEHEDRTGEHDNEADRYDAAIFVMQSVPEDEAEFQAYCAASWHALQRRGYGV